MDEPKFEHATGAWWEDTPPLAARAAEGAATHEP